MTAEDFSLQLLLLSVNQINDKVFSKHFSNSLTLKTARFEVNPILNAYL